MDAEGWRVFAGVRCEEDARSLRRAASERLTPLELDITHPAQISAAAEEISRTVGSSGLDGLVNNAGTIVVGPVETLPIADFRGQIEVNLIGQVAVAQALFPLIRQARGRVVFVSSIGGRLSYPFGAAYHASKFGLEAVADCMRQEVRQWGISVSVIEPGAIDTPIWDRGEKTVEELAARAPAAYARFYAGDVDRTLALGRKTLHTRASPPESVVRAILHALSASRPRRRYLVGLDARIQVRMHQLLPARSFDWLVAKMLGTDRTPASSDQA